MSVLSLLGNVDKQPQGRLQQMANQPNPDPLQALAAKSELMARNRPRPPMPAGLPALPTRGAIPRQYAGGGIVALNGEEGSYLGASQEDMNSGINPLTELELWGTGPNQRRPIGQMFGNNIVELGILKNQRDAYMKAGRVAEAQQIDRKIAELQAGPAAKAMQQPGSFAPNYSQAPTTLPWGRGINPNGSPPPGAGGLTSASMGARVGGRGGSAGLQPPVWYNPLEGAPDRRMTPDQREAFRTREAAELEKYYGKSPYEAQAEEVAGLEKGLAGKRDNAKNWGLVEAGLATLAGTSKHGLVNIGQGGLRGLQGYRAETKDLDAEERALRAQRWGTQTADFQHKTGIKDKASAAADKEDTQRAAERAEYANIVQSYNQHKKDLSQFGLDARKIDALFAEVEARRADTMQRATQHGDEKKWRAANETWAKAFEMAMAKYKSNPMALEKLAPEQFAAEVEAFRAMISDGNAEMVGDMQPGRGRPGAPSGSLQTYPTSRVSAKAHGLG